MKKINFTTLSTLFLFMSSLEINTFLAHGMESFSKNELYNPEKQIEGYKNIPENYKEDGLVPLGGQLWNAFLLVEGVLEKTKEKNQVANEYLQKLKNKLRGENDFNKEFLTKKPISINVFVNTHLVLALISDLNAGIERFSVVPTSPLNEKNETKELIEITLSLLSIDSFELIDMLKTDNKEKMIEGEKYLKEKYKDGLVSFDLNAHVESKYTLLGSLDHPIPFIMLSNPDFLNDPTSLTTDFFVDTYLNKTDRLKFYPIQFEPNLKSIVKPGSLQDPHFSLYDSSFSFLVHDLTHMISLGRLDSYYNITYEAYLGLEVLNPQFGSEALAKLYDNMQKIEDKKTAGNLKNSLFLLVHEANSFFDVSIFCPKLKDSIICNKDLKASTFIAIAYDAMIEKMQRYLGGKNGGLSYLAQKEQLDKIFENFWLSLDYLRKKDKGLYDKIAEHIDLEINPRKKQEKEYLKMPKMKDFLQKMEIKFSDIKDINGIYEKIESELKEDLSLLKNFSNDQRFDLNYFRSFIIDSRWALKGQFVDEKTMERIEKNIKNNTIKMQDLDVLKNGYTAFLTCAKEAAVKVLSNEELVISQNK